MVRVEHVMGTLISLDLRDAGIEAAVLDGVVAWFHQVDARFSPYRQDSEISRLGVGALSRGDCSADVREVLDLCDLVHEQSGGVFDVWAHRREGRLDPSALVKGWSVDRAAAVLEAAGAINFSINAGGDVLVRGSPQEARPWRVGVRHPDQAGRVAAVVMVTNCAVATSGAYERGDHIVDPTVGGAPSDLVSMTVVGPSLGLADAYSTAAYAMGRAGVAWIQGRPPYAAYAITADRHGVFTPDLARLLDRSRDSLSSRPGADRSRSTIRSMPMVCTRPSTRRLDKPRR